MKNIFKAMNTSFLIAGLPAKDVIKVKDWVHKVENKVSRFRSDSELYRLNSSTGKLFPVSDLFFKVMSEALLFYKNTKGLFNPFLGRNMVQLGYNVSFENLYTASKRLCSVKKTSFSVQTEKDFHKPLLIDCNKKTMQLADKIFIDLGGFAKGWCAQKAREKFGEKQERGLIDAGGDVIAWVNNPNDVSWCIGVANPMAPNEDIAALDLSTEVGIATSSTLKRSWCNERGQILHHILDPRTGLPADTDYVQVTVLAPSLTEAEVYAKCLIILGSKEGPAWIRQIRPDLGYIAIDQKGLVTVNKNLKKYCSNWEVFGDVKFVC